MHGFPLGICCATCLIEALAGMFARPGRMVLTVLGMVIGLTALVATVGLTRTAGNRIISQFDQLAATELFVTARPGADNGYFDPESDSLGCADRLLTPERCGRRRDDERGRCRRSADQRFAGDGSLGPARFQARDSRRLARPVQRGARRA